MVQYNPNDADSIQAIFDRDGEFLAREGFSLPPDLQVTADDERPRPEATDETVARGMSDVAIAAAAAWERTGSDELF